MDRSLPGCYIGVLRKRSTGMAPRTLSSTWRQFEKLARVATQSDPPPRRVFDELDDLCAKANRSKVVEALQTLFVLDHTGGDGIRVRFIGGQQAVERAKPVGGLHGAWHRCLKVGDLAQRMHPGIGAAGALNGNGVFGDFTQRDVNAVLHRVAIRL